MVLLLHSSSRRAVTAILTFLGALLAVYNFALHTPFTATSHSTQPKVVADYPTSFLRLARFGGWSGDNRQPLTITSWSLAIGGVFTLLTSMLFLLSHLKRRRMRRYNKNWRTLFRDDFPFFQKLPFQNSTHPVVYLDSAATSQKPAEVIVAINNWYSSESSNVHRSSHRMGQMATDKFEQVRSTVGDFINEKNPAESVVITRGTTHALNMLSRSITALPRSHKADGVEEVVVTTAEHHSNMLPWQKRCENFGGKFKLVPFNADVRHWASAVNESTRIVALTHVSHVMGTITDLSTIVPIIRQRAPNAIIVLDAAQSAPHLPLDVPSLGVDAVVASSHKFFGPTGVGFLWCSPKLIASLVPTDTGGGVVETVDADCSTLPTLVDFPHCMECGTPPIAEAIGMGAALKYIMRNRGVIKKAETELIMEINKRFGDLEKEGFIKILGDHQSPRVVPIVSFVPTRGNIHPADVAQIIDSTDNILLRAGHHCAIPLHKGQAFGGVANRGSVRVSAHAYNTAEEIRQASSAVRKAIEFISDSANKV